MTVQTTVGFYEKDWAYHEWSNQSKDSLENYFLVPSDKHSNLTALQDHTWTLTCHTDDELYSYVVLPLAIIGIDTRGIYSRKSRNR